MRASIQKAGTGDQRARSSPNAPVKFVGQESMGTTVASQQPTTWLLPTTLMSAITVSCRRRETEPRECARQIDAGGAADWLTMPAGAAQLSVNMRSTADTDHNGWERNAKEGAKSQHSCYCC